MTDSSIETYNYCEQELEKYNILLMVAEQQITLKKIVGKFSSSNDLKIRYESDKAPIILIVDIGTFMFNLEYNWKHEIWMSVWHKTKTNNNEKNRIICRCGIAAARLQTESGNT